MKREKRDKQFSKFMDILKQLYINIPFTEALTQMPSYAKFLKGILSRKRKLEDVSVVKLTEKCSIILQNKLPQKLVDPTSFTIPYTLGSAHFEKILCDSELGETKDIGVLLQLANQIHFIALEMEENIEVPLILGKPFLATGRAIIDVHQGQLILRVDEERVIFDMQKIMKFPGDESSSSYFQIDLLNDLANEHKDDQLITHSLERCLTRSGITSADNHTIREEAEILKKESENKEVSQEEDQSKHELKNLPSHLKYVFLEPGLFSVVPKKGGWRVCIDYRRLNEATRKDHFPLPFINKMFERVASNGFYCYLDGYYGYNKIPITPEDQEKTTFTCPQSMYAYRRMAFGLCNALAIFQLHVDDCMKAFEILKEQLTNAPVVISPDWSQSFEIMCDASDTAIGAILGQKRDKFFRPIYYARMKVRVFTDHATLKYLLAKKDARPRLLKWILLLQEFDLEIKDRKGSENPVADHLSRLENSPTETTYIKEEFPDEHIYTITTVTNQPPWFADVANYLVGGCMPKDFYYE
ncbi:uncharacterized protein LOC142175284 [Nicotiana tabacum]|uniref:Uncharacterized protein LOC142175284 n=1 Tax=Nicotiana tabacum TaxID=4097 RepID=A0AC58TL63_TOBAC